MFNIIFCPIEDREENACPIRPSHKRETRQRILESARRLFNSKGFAEVSIDEMMMRMPG